ncbi:MAG: cache domain-containing protein [Oligoflexia bacterium]|nr:cache domain-containing protein [Oligoflexia bacterium]
MKIFQVIGFFFFTGVFISCGGTPNLEITAEKVRDDKSLRAFVRAAKEHLETNYEQAVVDFGKEKRWRSKTVYLWSLKKDGSFLFHIEIPILKERKFESSETTDKFLDEGFRYGGGFVEYTVDNPAKEGPDQSRKIAYVIPFEREGEEYLIASGYYPDYEP